jgi:N-hydroxyarylamine O-acetyltransferase
VLSALHEAHVGAIPFENLDVLLGRPIALDLEALQAKMVAGRRGGYCFEQNTLFRGALDRLGFRVTSLAARVRAGVTSIRPRTHMLLRVDLPGGPFLADVGFGGEGPVHPLPLAADRQVGEGDFAHRLHLEDGWWVLQGNVAGDWIDLYAFTLEPHYPIDFEMANHYTSTYPSSSFRRNLTAQRSWPEGRVILRNRDLVLRSGGAARAETIRDPEHLLEALEQHFGLSFPKGTRFPCPEF